MEHLCMEKFYKSVNNKTNTKISIIDGLKATIVTLVKKFKK